MLTPSLPDRLLALPGLTAEADADAWLTVIRAGLLVHVTSVAAIWWLRQSPFEPHPLVRAAVAVALLGCTLVAVAKPRLARPAVLAGAALVATEVALRFPMTANHEVLGLLALGVVGVFGTDDAEGRRLALSGLRWLLLIVCTWAGLQKLISGAWLYGEFLAFEVATSDRFANVFQLLLSADELAALRQLGGDAPGAGPYRFTSPLALAATWAAWLGELVLPALLCIGRTRRIALVALLALIVLIEAGAHELAFGGLFVQLALLFRAGPPHRLTLPLVIVAYGLGTTLALTWGSR